MQAFMCGAVDNYRRLLLWTVICTFAVAIALPPLIGMQIDFASFQVMVLLCLVVGFFWPYAAWRQMTRVQAGIEVAIASFLFAIPLLVFTYMAMRFNLPLADERLVAMDAMLGFDGPGFVRLVDRNAMLSRLLGYCYASFTPQLVFLPVLLCALGHFARGYGMAFGLIVLGTISAAVSAFFPSVGAFAHYGLDAADLENINGFFGYHFLESFSAVREAPIYTLALTSASGIVTFPSVHAGVAVLCGWAAWTSRWLRWPFLVVNAGMFLSTLTHGAHYLVDVIAGTAIAVVTIWIVGRVFQVSPARRRLRSRDAQAAAA